MGARMQHAVFDSVDILVLKQPKPLVRWHCTVQPKITVWWQDYRTDYKRAVYFLQRRQNLAV